MLVKGAQWSAVVNCHRHEYILETPGFVMIPTLSLLVVAKVVMTTNGETCDQKLVYIYFYNFQ